MQSASLADRFAEAVQLHVAGRLAEAEASYRRVLNADPRHAASLHGLGVIAYQSRRHAVAVDLIGQALAIAPAVGPFHVNLGNALKALGRLEEAAGAYRRALAIDAGDTVSLNNLGNLLALQGRAAEAAAFYERALALRPDYVEAHYNLANLLADHGQTGAAIARYRQVLALRPAHLAARNSLGAVLRQAGQLQEAIACHQAVLAQAPGEAEAHSNLGRAFMLQGRLDEAGACYDRALALRPDDEAAQVNRLLWLNHVERDPREIVAAHRRWGELAARGLPAPAPHANRPDPDRRLRVGYVSPDLRAHSVAWYVAPLLAAHDRSTVEVFCYADAPRPDAVTARLRSLSDHWRDTAGLSDAALAELIRHDAIDVLVDVAGHGRGRLTMFALRPAPVQVTWLGYVNTTGLAAMDYRLVDAVTDPAGSDHLATETLVRLGGGFACFEPMAGAPEPAPPPCLAGAGVTFGSFSGPSKIGDRVVAAWSEILARTPGSRLLLKGPSFDDEGARSLLLERFARRGVAAERIVLERWIPSTADHLARYNAIDLALDPFPYNGYTTTCEALWMGVPVVALRGERHSARISASFLTRVGLETLIADDLAAYVSLAVELANAPQRLAELRRTLRAHMAASPLCDGPGFAREIEAAFRALWRAWCAAPGAAGPTRLSGR